MAEHTPRTVFQSHAPLAQIDHIFIQRCGKPITAAKTKNAALRLLRHWVNSTQAMAGQGSKRTATIRLSRITCQPVRLTHLQPTGDRQQLPINKFGGEGLPGGFCHRFVGGPTGRWHGWGVLRPAGVRTCRVAVPGRGADRPWSRNAHLGARARGERRAAARAVRQRCDPVSE
jgi:hypothetical protein